MSTRFPQKTPNLWGTIYAGIGATNRTTTATPEVSLAPIREHQRTRTHDHPSRVLRLPGSRRAPGALIPIYPVEGATMGTLHRVPFVPIEHGNNEHDKRDTERREQ